MPIGIACLQKLIKNTENHFWGIKINFKRLLGYFVHISDVVKYMHKSHNHLHKRRFRVK